MRGPWPWVRLSEVCTKITDGTHHSPDVQHTDPGKGRYKYVTSKNVRPWGLDLADIAYVDEAVHREIYARCNPEPGDVLLTKDGANTGTVAVNTLDEEFSLLSSVAVLKPRRDLLDPRFLRYFIESPAGSRPLAGDMTGTAIRRIILKKIKETEMPLPPLADQRSAVAEIEKQFTRLDAGVAALRRVHANLKRYRAAVLKAACEGRLVPTEAELARKEGRSFETGTDLLARILTDRRLSSAGRGKCREPLAANTERLPQLPEGWAWATPDQLADSTEGAICAGPFGTIFKAKDFRPTGVPIIFLRHVAPGKYLTHKPGFMDPEKWKALFRPYSVYGGELLVTKLGEPPGVCAIYPEDIGPAMVTPDVMKMTSNPAAALPLYLLHYFNSQTARDFATGVAFGTTRLRLTLPIFREMPVPLPPLAEQARIVAEVERRLSVVDELEGAVIANLRRATRLRQSVLQGAFAGALANPGMGREGVRQAQR